MNVGDVYELEGTRLGLGRNAERNRLVHRCCPARRTNQGVVPRWPSGMDRKMIGKADSPSMASVTAVNEKRPWASVL
jgi:hypothetical protein